MRKGKKKTKITQKEEPQIQNKISKPQVPSATGPGFLISDDPTAVPHSSAILDVNVTGPVKKGVLIPRMTEAERNAITSPATGLLIYQTDGTSGFYYYDGSTWTRLGGGTGLPAGTAGQTLRHDGTNWVANSVLYNDGNRIGINTTTPNPGVSLDVNGHLDVNGKIRSTTLATGGVNQVVSAASTGVLDLVPPGTPGQVLTWTSTGPSWRSNPFVVTILAQAGAATWVNQPNAVTELFNANRHRTRVDLTNATQARITVVRTGGTVTTTAGLAVQYSIDQVNWFYLDGVSGPSVNISPPGLSVSQWVDLASGARGDVYIRVVGRNGNGVADPAFGLITVQFR